MNETTYRHIHNKWKLEWETWWWHMLIEATPPRRHLWCKIFWAARCLLSSTSHKDMKKEIDKLCKRNDEHLNTCRGRECSAGNKSPEIFSRVQFFVPNIPPLSLVQVESQLTSHYKILFVTNGLKIQAGHY